MSWGPAPNPPHAAAPLLAVWDDREVDDSDADLVPENLADRPGFRNRRAAAYRAYDENMPLRRTSVPRGPDLELFVGSRGAAWPPSPARHPPVPLRPGVRGRQPDPQECAETADLRRTRWGLLAA